MMYYYKVNTHVPTTPLMSYNGCHPTCFPHVTVCYTLKVVSPQNSYC